MTVRDSITRTGARTPGAEDYPTSMAAHGRAPIPTQCGITAVVSTCAKGRHKPNISRCMPGAGLSRSMRGKVLPYMPAFQPYRGKPAVRNDREGRGNVGIIRSPIRGLDSTRLRGARGDSRPYRDMHFFCCAARLPSGPGGMAPEKRRMPSTSTVGTPDTIKTSLMRRSIGPCELLACIACPGQKRKVTRSDTGGCCKSLFALVIKISFGCTDFRV